MIVLFTDFGITGPYTGQMTAVLVHSAPGVPVVSLMADAPAMNPKASSYLLAAHDGPFSPGTVFLCVVDPGVGSVRTPVILLADGCYYVGPNNGLLSQVVRQATKLTAWEITSVPRNISATFHGRDIFAPVAAGLACGNRPDGNLIDPAALDRKSWPSDPAEIVYVDGYGNLMTGQRGSTCQRTDDLEWNGIILKAARTFSDVQPGEAIYYENSNGLMEIAVRDGSAASCFRAGIGEPCPDFSQ
ncbi:MAG: SAM-dependent chlorinase/fluorinase [Rhodospirillales bacterium]